MDLVLFADDTNVFFSHNNLSILTNMINVELAKLSEWFKANKLSINVSKSKYMIFKPRQKRLTVDLSIEVNNSMLDKAKEVMFLGVILDEHLSWKSHISHVANKISKSIGIIYRASFYLFKSYLRILFYSLVYPYLQYCTSVWGSTHPSNLNRLVLLQKRIVRILAKVPSDAHTDPIFKEFQLLKFEDIYFFQLRIFMYKYSNDLLPKKFDDMFPHINEIHNYNTRRGREFYLIKCRTNLRQFSINYPGPLFYNSLSSDIRDISSLPVFRSKLKFYLLNCKS